VLIQGKVIRDLEDKLRAGSKVDGKREEMATAAGKLAGIPGV